MSQAEEVGLVEQHLHLIFDVGALSYYISMRHTFSTIATFDLKLRNCKTICSPRIEEKKIEWRLHFLTCNSAYWLLSYGNFHTFLFPHTESKKTKQKYIPISDEEVITIIYNKLCCEIWCVYLRNACDNLHF